MLNFSDQYAYGLLAGLYAGSCIGLDKTLVSALVAVIYAVIAFKHGHSNNGSN